MDGGHFRSWKSTWLFFELSARLKKQQVRVKPPQNSMINIKEKSINATSFLNYYEKLFGELLIRQQGGSKY